MWLARREGARQEVRKAGEGCREPGRPFGSHSWYLGWSRLQVDESPDRLLAGWRGLLTQAMPSTPLVGGIGMAMDTCFTVRKNKVEILVPPPTASWVSHVPFRALVFLICKMGITEPSSWAAGRALPSAHAQHTVAV